MKTVDFFDGASRICRVFVPDLPRGQAVADFDRKKFMRTDEQGMGFTEIIRRQNQFWGVGAFRQLEFKPERAPLVQFAAEPDPPPHQFNELLGYRHAEPRTAVFPGRGFVHLGEFLEYPVLGLVGNAYARINYHEFQPDPGAWDSLSRHPHLNPALPCKLDGIADQVDEYLPQMLGISAQQDGGIGGNVGGKVQAFRPGFTREHGNR